MCSQVLVIILSLNYQSIRSNITRNWAYIISSIGLFLRQDEAANLVLSNITPATDPHTGEPTTTEGFPHCLVVTITSDKTNKDGQGWIVAANT